MKKFASLCLVSLLLLSTVLFMVSCDVYQIDFEYAKADIASFLNAVGTQDYEQAQSLLHPSYKKDLAAAMEELPAQYRGPYNIHEDSSALYEYNTNGISRSIYERSYSREVGNKEFRITVSVLFDEDGYGISGFTVDPVE